MNAPLSIVPRGDKALLLDLIELAELIMLRPHSSLERSERLAALTPEIAAAVARPAEDVRVMHAEVELLAEVLAHVEAERRYGSEERAMHWQMIAGVLLPMVRINLAVAIGTRR